TEQTGSAPMAVAAADTLTGTIPAQEEGRVVQYRVNVELSDGSTVSYPDNAADPFYEFFVGAVEPLYCTDFETDPKLDGWTHGLPAGVNKAGADDWQWGVPSGKGGSGDPDEAFSGKRVWGNDLGNANFDGNYQPDVTNWSLSPLID